MNVVRRRNERIEVARHELVLLRNLELRPRRVAPVIEPAIDRLVLLAAIHPDQPPREMIVHRC